MTSATDSPCSRHLISWKYSVMVVRTSITELASSRKHSVQSCSRKSETKLHRVSLFSLMTYATMQNISSFNSAHARVQVVCFTCIQQLIDRATNASSAHGLAVQLQSPYRSHYHSDASTEFEHKPRHRMLKLASRGSCFAVSRLRLRLISLDSCDNKPITTSCFSRAIT